MPRAFVIRGFGKHKDSSGAVFDFDRVDTELVTPALQQCGLVVGTTGQIIEAGNIRVDMFAMIVEADIVICDITVHNANVFYELGIRHSMRKKHTLLIKADPTGVKTSHADLLEASNQAIRRFIANPRTRLTSRAEALAWALHGPHLKTLWRREIPAAGSPRERRAIALNGKRKESFEAW
jgi:hypothetical protein